MLAVPARAAHAIGLACAAGPLSREAREALLPPRLGTAWITARWLDQAVARLDLSCLHRLYRRRGSLPFSAVLMLELALFCIADGLPSPVDWADMANRDGPSRWIAWGIQPSASVCYAFRDRLGEDCLLELNRQVLALAIADGLTKAKRAAIDGTTQQACASRHRLVNEDRLQCAEQAVQEPVAAAATTVTAVDAAEAAAAVTGQPKAAPSGEALARQPVVPEEAVAGKAAPVRPRSAVRPGRTKAGRARQRKRLERAKQQMQQRQARNQAKRKSKRSDPKKIVVSANDPEAANGLDKLGTFRPLYNAQLAADLDSPLILAYQALAQPNDNGLLGQMLDRCQELSGHKLEVVLVDAGYTGGMDLSEAEQRGVQVLGPRAGQSGEAQNKPEQIAKSEFSYDAQRRTYVCPQGKSLERVAVSKQKRSSVELVVLEQYRAAAGECDNCPRQQECCPKSKQGRSISRSEHEGAIERLEQRMSQPENKQLYKRRAATVERLFGDAKQQRGLNRVCGRGLGKARIQLALTVLQHNLRVLGRAMQAANKDKSGPPAEPRTT